MPNDRRTGQSRGSDLLDHRRGNERRGHEIDPIVRDVLIELFATTRDTGALAMIRKKIRRGIARIAARQEQLEILYLADDAYVPTPEADKDEPAIEGEP